MSLESIERESLSSKIKALQNKIEKSNEDINKKLRNDFLANMNDVVLKLWKDLARIYKTNNIEIKFSSKRSIDKQIQAIEDWKSQTVTSLHSIGMAVDIVISIDWVTQNADNPKTTIPYQMLGYYTLQKWYFWWYTEDSGHIWFVENIPELLSKYPSFAKSYDICRIYTYLTKQDVIDIKYKKFIDIYEKISNFKNKKIMKYDDSKKEVIRWRLKPIDPRTYKVK